MGVSGFRSPFWNSVWYRAALPSVFEKFLETPVFAQRLEVGIVPHPVPGLGTKLRHAAFEKIECGVSVTEA